MSRQDIDQCPMGRIEMGERQVQLVTLLPESIVHYRVFLADTPEQLHQDIAAFESRVLADGGAIYQVDCLSDDPLVYMVTHYRSQELELGNA